MASIDKQPIKSACSYEHKQSSSELMIHAPIQKIPLGGGGGVLTIFY